MQTIKTENKKLLEGFMQLTKFNNLATQRQFGPCPT